MPFFRASILIFMLSFLLPACFHDGPTIHEDPSDGETSDSDEPAQTGELPVISVSSPSSPDLAISEDSNSIILRVSLSAPIKDDINVSYQATALADVSNSATRQDDFLILNQGRNASSDVVTIAAETTEANFAININRDLVDESDEVFAINLKLNTPVDTAPKAILATNQLVVTILDDDPLPVVQLFSEKGTTIEVDESIGAIALELRMPFSYSSRNVEIPVDIYFPSTQAATTGEDFVKPSALIYPAATTDNKNPGVFKFELLIHDDAIKEETETFFFSLFNPLYEAATLGDNTFPLKIIIKDDDAIGGINDTQVETCANGILHSTACNNTEYPVQDGDLITEYQTQWLNTNGDVVTSDATAVCVKDLNTGLIWEMKSNDNGSLQYKNWTFSWYNDLSNSNGGYDGLQGGTSSCESTVSQCNTKNYLAKLNENDGICGNTNWRMPRVHELASIMNFGSFPDLNNPIMADQDNFPNTQQGYYWTASPLTEFTLEAWAVYFGKTPPTQQNSEFIVPYSKTEFLHIRAVANSQ